MEDDTPAKTRPVTPPQGLPPFNDEDATEVPLASRTRVLEGMRDSLEVLAKLTSESYELLKLKADYEKERFRLLNDDEYYADWVRYFFHYCKLRAVELEAFENPEIEREYMMTIIGDDQIITIPRLIEVLTQISNTPKFIALMSHEEIDTISTVVGAIAPYYEINPILWTRLQTIAYIRYRLGPEPNEL